MTRDPSLHDPAHPHRGYGDDAERAYGYGYDDDWEDESEHGKSSDDIRAQIQHTRSELDRIIDELQHRLSPQQLVRGAFDALRDSARDPVDRALSALRENPVPAALIGLGVIWLLVNQARSKRREFEADVEPTTTAHQFEYEEYEGVGERLRPVM